MTSTWVQLWVKHPDISRNTPSVMLHAEELIYKMGGLFVSTPIKTADDAYEVRVFGPSWMVERADRKSVV